jgi:hypothetical protein
MADPVVVPVVAPVTDTTDGKEVANVEPAVDPWKTSKHKVKLGDHESEVSYEELVNGFQMAKSSQSKYKEASEIRNQALELIELLKTDPKAALSHQAVGVDVIKFAQDILAHKLEEDVLTPEQKELRDLRMLRDSTKAKEDEQKKQLEQQQADELRKKYEQDYTIQFQTALTKSGLPATKQTLGRMAYYMAEVIKEGHLNVTADDVTPWVREDYLNDIKALFGASDESTLLQLLGDDITNKVVKGHVNKVKKPGTTPKSAGTPSRKKEDKPMSEQEYWEGVRARSGKMFNK